MASDETRVSDVSLLWTCLGLRAVLICAWAEKGADALGPDGLIVHSDAFPPESLVDTLGAGDTFNAAVIYTLSNGESPALITVVNGLEDQTQTLTKADDH